MDPVGLYFVTGTRQFFDFSWFTAWKLARTTAEYTEYQVLYDIIIYNFGRS